MHLTGIRLGGVPPFTEPIRLRFDERVNVFIGPNASGKSTVLTMMADFFQVLYQNSNRSLPRNRRLSPDWCDDFPKTELDEPIEWNQPIESVGDNFLGLNEDWPAVEDDIPNFGPDTPLVVHFGSIRPELPDVSADPPPNEFSEKIEEVMSSRPFSGYRTVWAYKLLGDEFQRASPSRIQHLLRTADAKGIYDWITNNPEESAVLRKWAGLQKAAELADKCSKQICDEIIVDSKPHNYVHAIPQGNNISALIVLPLMGANTVDFRDAPPFQGFGPQEDSYSVYLGHLSSGTAGILLWIRWLSLKMANRYDFAAGWDKKPAILLIDEIENHLHPTWQRRVIPALLEHFPRLQIFATTHSPFVVAGLKAGQVHVLKRENGKVTAETEPRDVVGWTMDEILRGMMGVEDPTDEDTAAAARELRQLRNEGPRVDEKAEEMRQQRMLELRGMVDRDLLAGGPVAAQRELFEQNLADILEEHRKAQGLNQD